MARVAHIAKRLVHVLDARVEPLDVCGEFLELHEGVKRRTRARAAGAVRETLSAFGVDGQVRKKTRKLIHLIRTENGLDLLIVPDQDVTKMHRRKGTGCYGLLRVNRGVIGDEGLLERGRLAHAATETAGGG
jgi:hypothetical protein